MHLWATQKLADEIAAGNVTAREKATYFVIAQVLFIAVGYAAAYGPSHLSWLYLYEGVLVAVVTFAGAQKVVASYERPIDGEFFQMSFLLSVPIFVKTTMASWVAIYGGYWLFGTVLPQISTDSADSARALSYWVPRAWELLPFFVGVIVAIVFWLRLAHHVRYVAQRRGA